MNRSMLLNNDKENINNFLLQFLNGKMRSHGHVKGNDAFTLNSQSTRKENKKQKVKAVLPVPDLLSDLEKMSQMDII